MTLQNLKDYRERGFTIVELLIVIVVIAILATLVITAYNGVQQRARDSKRTSDVRAVQTYVEAFNSENGKYPTLTEVTGNTGVVKLDSTLVSNIKATAPSGTDANTYQYKVCQTGTAPSVSYVGAKIMYWLEGATPNLQTKDLGTVSGTGVTCP